MVRKIFFSFHYENDNWRAAQVRNSWVTKVNKTEAGYIDKAAWEKLKRKGQAAIKKWIETNMKGTSVTTVLIGAETASRPWVQYEIKESFKKGKGMLGIYVNNLKDSKGNYCKKGQNPFKQFYIEKNGKKIYFSELYPTYNWVNDRGYQNFGYWVEKAAKNI